MFSKSMERFGIVGYGIEQEVGFIIEHADSSEAN